MLLSLASTAAYVTIRRLKVTRSSSSSRHPVQRRQVLLFDTILFFIPYPYRRLVFTPTAMNNFMEMKNMDFKAFMKFATTSSSSLKSFEQYNSIAAVGRNVYSVPDQEKDVILSDCFKRNDSVLMECKKLKLYPFSDSLNKFDFFFEIDKINFPSKSKDIVTVNQQIFNRLKKTHFSVINDNFNNSFERTFDSLPDLFSGGRCVYYCYNLKLNNLVPSRLEDHLRSLNKFKLCSNNIDTSNNPFLGICEGINTAMFYVSSQGSFSEMHVENNDLESFNFVHFNLVGDRDKPSKLWLFVRDKQRLIERIVADSEIFNLNLENSKNLFNHKNIYVTPSYLKKVGVAYDSLVQYPGDIVYVKPGVFHQVLNLNANFAEAINFGSDLWNVMAKNIVSCGCKYDKLTNVQYNIARIHSVKSRSFKVHDCPFENCDFYTVNLNNLTNHYKENHENITNKQILAMKGRKLRNKSEKFCRFCRINVSNYYSHVKSRKHKEKIIDNPDVCDDPAIDRNRQDNIADRRVNRNRKFCDECNIFVSNIYSHVKSKKHMDNIFIFCEKN